MTEMTLAPPAAGDTLRVPRWETEIPLLILVILTSLALWMFIVISMIGIFYAIFFAIFFFLAHVGFIAHLRGSSVKLGPDQMPELYARVQSISRRFGLQRPPDAYVMQAGGVLNALATKLLRSNFIVLYSELLEACDGDDRAADFVIAHELGHLKAGHLRFQWFLLPGRVFPFIGSAYSRAREYTADRFGASISSEPSSAVRGLTILAAGPMHAKKVNLAAFMQQQRDMNTVLMTLGSWMASHPPIVRRIAALDRALAGERVVAGPAILGAAGLIALGFLAPMLGGAFVMQKFMKTIQEAQRAAQRDTSKLEPAGPRKVEVTDVPAAVARAQRDMRSLAAVADAYRAGGSYPEDTSTLYALWRAEHPRDPEPFDPFDGEHYGYLVTPDGYEIYSSGQDRDDVAADALRIKKVAAPPPAPRDRAATASH
jgi:Zn-dependent protease with chaperone function